MGKKTNKAGGITHPNFKYYKAIVTKQHGIGRKSYIDRSGDRLSLVIILILEEQQFNLRCERQSVNERNDISALHDTKMFMVSNLGKFYFII